MKILFITHTTPNTPSKDGMSLIAFYLLKYLKDKHEVTVLTSDQFNKRKKLIKHYLFSKKNTPWYIRKNFNPSLAKMITEDESNFDLIYLHSPFSLGYLPYIKKTPVVVGLIDTMSSWFKQMAAHEKNVLKKWHFKNEHKLSLQFEQKLNNDLIKKIIVVSQQDKNELIASMQFNVGTGRDLSVQNKIEIVPNGIDLETFKPDEKITKNKSIIFTGVMDYPPNIDAVNFFYKNVWPAVQGQNIKWLIVGKNPKNSIKKLEIKEPNIIVTGLVSDMPSYLNQAQIYIAPLRLGTGIKNKILEAMSCGLPVIALESACGGLEKAPIIKSSEQDFAKNILDLFNDNQKIADLGKQGRLYIEQNHNWDDVVKKYEEIFIGN